MEPFASLRQECNDARISASMSWCREPSKNKMNLALAYNLQKNRVKSGVAPGEAVQRDRFAVSAGFGAFLSSR
ncbi:unnamed protein product, partial [Iphiclides podalirius]